MTRIQIRRDTSVNWATYNPILADGEFALETDTRKIKIGNGEQPYTELAYQGDSELPDNITTQGNTFNGANQLVQLDSTGKLPAIDGSQLTNLPVSPTPSNIVTTKNIPTKGLKYWTGTEAAYTELGTKDADTLYRTTDTNKVYLGTIQIGGN